MTKSTTITKTSQSVDLLVLIVLFGFLGFFGLIFQEFHTF